MSTFSMQVESGLGRGMGMVVTVAVHVLAAVFLLSGREQLIAEPMPLMARIVSDSPSEQQAFEHIQTRPTLERPQLQVQQPELVLAETAMSAMATVAAASISSPVASRATAQPARETLPRFDADYLNNPAPAYPRVSRRLREQGVVMLRVFVQPSGLPDVVELQRSSGSPHLDASAVDAVRKWKFVPAQSAGRVVGAWVIVPIEFSLNA